MSLFPEYNILPYKCTKYKCQIITMRHLFSWQYSSIKVDIYNFSSLSIPFRSKIEKNYIQSLENSLTCSKIYESLKVSHIFREHLNFTCAIACIPNYFNNINTILYLCRRYIYCFLRHFVKGDFNACHISLTYATEQVAVSYTHLRAHET